jgi:hypothetical protein
MEEKTKSKKVGAPEGNTNALVWTYEKAEALLLEAAELSKSEEYDFIGEVAKDLDTTHQTLNDLCKKYPALKTHFNTMKSNCEVNCYRNGKKGKINTAMSIVNLKSNHGWTDRVDNTTQGEKIETKTTVVNYKELSNEFLDEIAKKSANWRE